MRKKMEDHMVRADCRQCHVLMDPIGFALENFDGIGLWRTLDEGESIDSSASTFDNTKLSGPTELRQWIVSRYADQFVTVATEKLMIYALGRGLEPQDMPLVRKLARNAAADGSRFSSLVLGIVRSDPFQMNMKVQGAPAQTADARIHTTNGKGNH